MLLRVVTRSLRQHALSTIVTALSLGLGAGLVMAVFQVAQQTERAEQNVGLRSAHLQG